MNDEKKLLSTMTGEIFQPIRLFYKIHKKVGVEISFKKLRCMDYDADQDRWVWLFDDESKKLKFKNSYSSIPMANRPIILGAFYSRVDDQMYLDVGSIDRAIHAIEFFNKHIKINVAEVEYVSIYNKLASSREEWPGTCFDALFAEVCAAEIDGKLQEKLHRAAEAINLEGVSDILNDRRFDLVEAFRINNCDDGLKQLKSILRIREIVAMKRWEGDVDYCISDFVKSMMESMR